MPRVTGIFQSASLRIVYMSFNLFEDSCGSLVPHNILSHFIVYIESGFFPCHIESLFIQNGFVFCELSCRTDRSKLYCSKLVSPSPCADFIPVFSGTSSRTHRILSPRTLPTGRKQAAFPAQGFCCRCLIADSLLRLSFEAEHQQNSRSYSMKARSPNKQSPDSRPGQPAVRGSAQLFSFFLRKDAAQSMTSPPGASPASDHSVSSASQSRSSSFSVQFSTCSSPSPVHS